MRMDFFSIFTWQKKMRFRGHLHGDAVMPFDSLFAWGFVHVYVSSSGEMR